MDDWGLGSKTQSIEDKIKDEIAESKAEKKASDVNIFHIISTAVDRKFIPTEEQYNKIPTYLFLRYFSNDPTGLTIVNELNIRKNIPHKWEYWFMRLMMPKSIRYIRPNKKEKIDDEGLLHNMTHYYKCNIHQAMEYYKMLPESELNKLREIYRYGRA